MSDQLDVAKERMREINTLDFVRQIKDLKSQLAALKLENEKLVEEVAKVNRFRESLATKHRFANDLLAEYQAREMLRSEFERAEIERVKGGK